MNFYGDRSGFAADRVYPSHYLRQVYAGKMMLADVPDEWRDCVVSMLQLPVYQKACEVMAGITPDGIKLEISRLNASIRDLVHVEARRVYALRNGL